MNAQTELENFRDFVTQQLSSGKTDLSPEQCLDIWRMTHPNEGQAAEDLSAVYASIDDFKRGERGRPAGQTTGELRQAFGDAAAQ